MNDRPIRLTVEEAHTVAIALNAAILYDLEKYHLALGHPIQVRRERLFQFFMRLEERLREDHKR